MSKLKMKDIMQKGDIAHYSDGRTWVIDGFAGRKVEEIGGWDTGLMSYVERRRTNSACMKSAGRWFTIGVLAGSFVSLIIVLLSGW